MPKLTSAIDPHSPAFKALDAHNRALRDELHEKVAKAVPGDYIGVKVSDRVRPGDEVFRVVPD